MRRITRFFSDCYRELRRVTWPSSSEVAESTKVVIVSVSIFAIVLGFIDLALLQIIDILF